MINYIKLMRIKHYVKNFLIFFPIILSGNLFNMPYLIKSIYAFIAFSLATSVVYIVNDIKDKDKDKKHPIKKNRPLASGKIEIKNAIVFAIILFSLSLLFQFLAVCKITHMSYLYILVYIVINILYSFGLKDIPLLDVAILALGFIIRVLYGGSIINVEISSWLYLTVMSLAFYLGFGKRRNEFIKSGNKSRKVLNYYNESFLDKSMYMCLAISVVFYSLWTIDITTTSKYLIWTIPLVILIMLKYCMIVENDSFGDPVDVVTSDKILLGMIFIYGLILMGLIYLS